MQKTDALLVDSGQPPWTIETPQSKGATVVRIVTMCGPIEAQTSALDMAQLGIGPIITLKSRRGMGSTGMGCWDRLRSVLGSPSVTKQWSNVCMRRLNAANVDRVGGWGWQ